MSINILHRDRICSKPSVNEARRNGKHMDEKPPHLKRLTFMIYNDLVEVNVAIVRAVHTAMIVFREMLFNFVTVLYFAKYFVE